MNDETTEKTVKQLTVRVPYPQWLSLKTGLLYKGQTFQDWIGQKINEDFGGSSGDVDRYTRLTDYIRTRRAMATERNVRKELDNAVRAIEELEK